MHQLVVVIMNFKHAEFKFCR